jgi:hypothetical protein
MIEFAVGNYIFLKEAGKIYAGKAIFRMHKKMWL